MRSSRVKAKLRRNEPVLVTSAHFFDPSVYELTSLMGFDAIWMDLEHHGTSVETALTLLRAARVGASDVMVRPAKGEFMRMGRLLEGGAAGIMYPRCSSADEARELVSWAKFAPLGRRGFDGGNADMPYCAMPIPEYVRRANEETFLVVQIEDPQALVEAPEIAAVDGVDVLFLGPADFTILSGIPGEWNHPKVDEAIRAVAEAARKAGKHWGMPAFNLDWARRLLEQGARFLAHGGDLTHVINGMKAVQQTWGPLGFTFDKRL